MKVVHLTSVHPVTDTRILHKECSTLAGAGHEVVIVVPHESDGVIGKIRIHSVPLPESRAHRLLFTTWRVYRAAVAEKADIYHFHDSELIPFGILLRLQGKKVIYDVHEDLPGTIRAKIWITPVLRRAVAAIASFVEWIAAKIVDVIVVASPAISRRFPGGKTVLVQNFPIMGELSSSSSQPFAERPPHLLYVGALSEARGIVNLVRAMECIPGGEGIRLILAGGFSPPGLEEELSSMEGWGSVDYVGWQSREQLSDLLGTVRGGLVTFLPAPNHIESQPNKLFEYLSAGIPIVASDFPLWRSMIDSVECGVLVDPDNHEEIAGAMKWLIDHPDEAEEMGRRGRRAIEEKYNWDNEAGGLLELYDRLGR